MSCYKIILSLSRSQNFQIMCVFQVTDLSIQKNYGSFHLQIVKKVLQTMRKEHICQEKKLHNFFLKIEMINTLLLSYQHAHGYALELSTVVMVWVLCSLGFCGIASKQWANVFSFVYMHLIFYFYILHSSLRYDIKCLIAYSSTAEVYTFMIAVS